MSGTGCLEMGVDPQANLNSCDKDDFLEKCTGFTQKMSIYIYSINVSILLVCGQRH